MAAPTPVASGTCGPQVRQGLVSTVGDRDEMVDIGGGCPAMDANPAVAHERLPPDRLPAPAAGPAQPAGRAAASRRQPAAAEAGL
jgi:hypothetical protein